MSKRKKRGVPTLCVKKASETSPNQKRSLELDRNGNTSLRLNCIPPYTRRSTRLNHAEQRCPSQSLPIPLVGPCLPRDQDCAAPPPSRSELPER